MSVLKTAASYLAAGLNIVPLLLDGSKAPSIKWQSLVEQQQKSESLADVFSDAVGIGVLGGSTSGGLEIVDFDDAALFDPWRDLVEAIAPGLTSRLPIVKTPNGYHVYFRSAAAQGNQKLAMGDKPTKGKKQPVLIETRGHGGYVIAPGSPARVHPSGTEYVMHSGSLQAVPTLSEAERDVLLSCARSFNKVALLERHETKAQGPKGEGRPGDDYLARSTWNDVMLPHGWQNLRTVGNTTYWRRPGKNAGGISATTGYCGDYLYVFSSNAAPFETGRAYNRFSAYTHLNHDSDFSAASRALRAQGYGAPNKTPPRSQSWDELASNEDVAPKEPSKEPKAEITAAEIDNLLDADSGAALVEPTFSRLIKAKEDPAEWQRITKVLGRHKAQKSFDELVRKKAPKPKQTENWKERLLYREAKNGGQVLENVLNNLVTVLTYDGAWAGVLSLDTFARQITCKRPPPFERRNERWEDADLLKVKEWVIRNYALRPSTETVSEAVTLVATNNAFNPLTDYLDGLPVSDKEMIDTWLVDFFGAEDNEYTRAVGARWLIAAVARAYDPGCKVDTVLILEGEQGQRKSSVLDKLCPSLSWFADGLSDFGSKAQAEEVQGKWIIELGELKGFGREQEQIKAFVTRRAENYRPAYGRNTIHVPRTCVFAGTVNPDGAGYLRDSTGNRRYWPVRCTKRAEPMTAEIRDHLWAEARDRYRNGERWWIDEDEKEIVRIAKDEQEKRVHADAWHETLAKYLETQEDVSMDAMLEHLKIEVSKRDASVTSRVGRVAHQLGFERYQRRMPGNARVYRYRRIGALGALLPFKEL